MLAATMNQENDNGRAVAWAARINAASQDTAAVRACLAPLERQAIAAQQRAARLAARLARIESYARRALAHARDDQARLVLGDIAVTAGERDALTVVG